MITFTELKNKSGYLYPAILLDKYIDRKTRKVIRFIFLNLSIILLFFIFYFENTNIRGGLFVSLSIWSIFQLLEAMYLYFYFSRMEVDFEVARLIFMSDEDDIVGSFLYSQMGYFTMLRLGIDVEQIKEFLNSNRKMISEGAIDIFEDEKSRFIGIKEYCGAIYNYDKDFAIFLKKHNISKDIFLGAVEWIDETEWWSRNQNRFWLKENLSKIKSIGRNWDVLSPSPIYEFGYFATEDDNFMDVGDGWKTYVNIIDEIESKLISDRLSNILIITPDEKFGSFIINCFTKFIIDGRATSDIENKKIFIVDDNKILNFLKQITESSDKKFHYKFNFFKDEKTEAEKITKIFNIIFDEASKIENIILVFPMISNTAEFCHKFGINFSDTIKNLLNKKNVQCFFITNSEDFYSNWETDIELIKNFKKISIQEYDLNFALNILEARAIIYEQESKIFFTYQSLLAIAKISKNFHSKEQYFDKMLYFLDKVSEFCLKEQNYYVTEKDVNRIISINNEN